MNDSDPQLPDEHSWWAKDEDFPYGVHCPSHDIQAHQDKWGWLVHQMYLNYGEDWMLRVPESSRTYDVWCFKEEKNAIAFCLKWA